MGLFSINLFPMNKLQQEVTVINIKNKVASKIVSRKLKLIKVARAIKLLDKNKSGRNFIR